MDQAQTMLRLASLTDLKAVERLSMEAYAGYTELLGALPRPATEDYAPRIVAGLVWLLEDAGGLRGVLVLERHPSHAMIYSVAVAPSWQGCGLGSKLLRFAEAKAREWGVAELRLYTNARMERNVAIYRAAGYREVARRPHPRRPGFILVDMAKSVAR